LYNIYNNYFVVLFNKKEQMFPKYFDEIFSIIIYKKKIIINQKNIVKFIDKIASKYLREAEIWIGPINKI